MTTKATNIQYLDTLRGFATLSVIIVHVTTPVLKMMYGRNMEFWWIGNIIDSCVRFVIPVFLMLSGATMLGKEYSLMEFYKKRWMRVLVPFLFWMVAYWIFRWSMLMPKEQPKELHSILQWAVDLFFKQGISKHLWYIYMILCIYLFVPFMGKAIRRLSDSTILYLLMGWILLNQAQITGLISLASWPPFAQKLYGYLMYSGFLVLGYSLFKMRTPSNKIRYWAIIVFLLTIIVSAVATYFLSRQAHKLDTTMYGSLTLNTMLQSAALFILLKDFTFTNRILNWTISTMSNYSYGIYLVHIMVIDTFFRNGIFWTMAYPLISLPVVVMLTLITSLGIIFLLRKIPFGKYISG